MMHMNVRYWHAFWIVACLIAPFLAPVNAAADYLVGAEAYEQGDYATALREWRPFAEQGDAEAQYNLGVMYANGEGVPKDDAEALKWYRKAAEQGFAKAQLNLGVMYTNGEGVR